MTKSNILTSRSKTSSVLTMVAIAVAMIAGAAMTTNQSADAGYGFYGYRAYRPAIRPRVVYRPRVVVAPPVVVAPRTVYRPTYGAVIPAPVVPVPAYAPPTAVRYGSYYGGYGVSVSPYGVSVGYGVAPVGYYHY